MRMREKKISFRTISIIFSVILLIFQILNKTYLAKMKQYNKMNKKGKCFILIVFIFSLNF